jgi:hypothetical protein
LDDGKPEAFGVLLGLSNLASVHFDLWVVGPMTLHLDLEDHAASTVLGEDVETRVVVDLLNGVTAERTLDC